MPQISKVGDGWAGLEDYATLGSWWATESAIDYGAPIEAALKGNFGAGETLSGASVNGAIAYTDSVIFDGTNENLLAICDRLTVSVTNSLTLNDLIIRTTNQYVSAFSLSSDSVTSNRCVFDNQTAGVNAIVINGYYPNTNINNFVARGGLDTLNAGYLRGTNFNKGLVYGASGFGVNGSAGAGNFVLTDIFAFGNGTDYDTANLTLNNCASQDLTGTTGLTGYTSTELVNFSGADYRTKSTSALATAGTVDFIGAFLEASGGGSLSISPSGISSAESFGNTSVQLSLSIINPSGIVSSEVFGAVDIKLLTSFINPSGITSSEILGTPIVTVGIYIINTVGISTQESVGVPSLAYAQLLDISGIASELSFGIAIVSDGLSIVIPITNRKTTQEIYSYLMATGKFVSSSCNDLIVEWLRYEGVTEAAINDMFCEYWKSKGYSGAYNDKLEKWIKDV